VGRPLCDVGVVLGQFKDVQEYREFLDINTVYFREKKELQRYLLEE